MRFTLAVFLGLVINCLAVVPVLAKDTIRGNVAFDYNYINYDGDYVDRADSEMLSVTKFLSPVEKKRHPWKEADFFERTSRLNAAVGIHKTKYSQATSDGSFLSVGGAYASPNHLLVLRGSVNRSKDENDSDDFKDTFENTSYQVYIGSYIGTNLLVGIDYGRDKFEDTYESKYSDSRGSSETDEDNYGLSAKFLTEYPNGMAFGLYARGEYQESKLKGFGATDYDRTFKIVPEIYFNQTTSLKLQLFRSYFGSDDNLTGTHYGITLHRFFSHMFALEASVTKFDYKSSEGVTVDSADTMVGLAAELWF